MSRHQVEKFVEFCNTEFGSGLMDMEAELITEAFSDCEKTLSVGCGIGSIGERIKGKDIFYLDSSPQMLLEAEKRVKGPLVLASAEMMPFKSCSFDCTYSVTALEFMENPKKAVRETARVLKPDGKVLVMMLNPSSKYFKSHVKRKGSYFRKIQSHPKTIDKYMKEYFSTESEYFLGIDGKEIFDTKNPEKASLYVIKGVKNL